MTAHGISRAQSQLLGFIATYIAERGYSPTFAEMAADLQIKSKGYISALLDGLVERGHVTRLPHRARSVLVADTKAVHDAVRFRSVSHETSAPSRETRRDGCPGPIRDTVAARASTRATGSG